MGVEQDTTMQNRSAGASPLNVVRVFQPDAIDIDDLLRALELLLTTADIAGEPVNHALDPPLAFEPQESESCVTGRGPQNANLQ